MNDPLCHSRSRDPRLILRGRPRRRYASSLSGRTALCPRHRRVRCRCRAPFLSHRRRMTGLPAQLPNESGGSRCNRVSRVFLTMRRHERVDSVRIDFQLNPGKYSSC